MNAEGFADRQIPFVIRIRAPQSRLCGARKFL
jgi:hypothetical protein